MRVLRAMLILALALLAITLADGIAEAKTEYCPANVQSYYRVGGGDYSFYSFVLSAMSERTVQGTVLAQTTNGWYTIPFPSTPLVHYEQRYHNAYTKWQRDIYVSPVLFVRFPIDAGAVTGMWVLKAQATGDTIFKWDERGAVTCKLTPSAAQLGTPRETRRSPPSTPSTAIDDSPSPYDLEAVPSASDVIIHADPATLAPTAQCASPFETATATSKITPPWPSGVLPAFHPTTVMVEVAVSHDGRPDDAWVFQPSGVSEFDAMALAAATASTYRAPRAFCQPAPGFYLFVVTFGAAN